MSVDKSRGIEPSNATLEQKHFRLLRHLLSPEPITFIDMQVALGEAVLRHRLENRSSQPVAKIIHPGHFAVSLVSSGRIRHFAGRSKQFSQKQVAVAEQELWDDMDNSIRNNAPAIVTSAVTTGTKDNPSFGVELNAQGILAETKQAVQNLSLQSGISIPRGWIGEPSLIVLGSLNRIPNTLAAEIVGITLDFLRPGMELAFGSPEFASHVPGQMPDYYVRL